MVEYLELEKCLERICEGNQRPVKAVVLQRKEGRLVYGVN